MVCRAFLQALMIRLGFPKEVIDAWFAYELPSCQTLIAGAVYGDSSSSTGIPEGDPMSILGMFALCCLFREVVANQSVRALVFSYADNWEVVVDDTESLQDILPGLFAPCGTGRMLDLGFEGLRWVRVKGL